MYAIVHGVINSIKHLGTPWKTLRTWARYSHQSLVVESKVPQLQSFPAITFEECIKFRMNFTEHISVLDCKWMSFESIDADRKNLILVHYDATMLLSPWNLKAMYMSKVY